MAIYDQPKQRNKAKGFFGMPDSDERQKLIDEADQHIKGIGKNGNKLGDSHRIGTLNKIARLEPDVRDDVLGAAQISTTRLTNTLHNLSDSLEGKPPSRSNSPADAIFDTDPANLQAAMDRSYGLMIKGKPKPDLAGKNNLAVNQHAPAQSDADPIKAIGLDVAKSIPDPDLREDSTKPAKPGNTQIAGMQPNVPGYQWGSPSGPIGHINRAEKEAQAAGKQLGTDGQNLAGGAKARGLHLIQANRQVGMIAGARS